MWNFYCCPPELGQLALNLFQTLWNKFKLGLILCKYQVSKIVSNCAVHSTGWLQNINTAKQSVMNPVRVQLQTTLCSDKSTQVLHGRGGGWGRWSVCESELWIRICTITIRAWSAEICSDRWHFSEHNLAWIINAWRQTYCHLSWNYLINTHCWWSVLRMSSIAGQTFILRYPLQCAA